MRIIFSTFVTQEYREVTQKFDQKLLLTLSPPFPRVRIIRYDGNQPGNEVHIRLHFGFRQFLWKSLITEYRESGQRLYFVDEGIQLPWPLRYWRHRHEIRRQDADSLIIDDVTYRAGAKWLDFLLYPFIFLQLLYRKPIYKRYFKKKVT